MKEEKSICHIFLIGFMGAGKSTVAQRLRQRLGMELVEMDAELVKREGMPISDIFEKHGEEYFRDSESRLVSELSESEGKIVSCGGGAVIRSQNVEKMKKSGKIVLLSARPETIFERVRHSTARPILNGHMDVEYIRTLMEKRRALYEGAADFTVATDQRTIDEICDEIIRVTGICNVWGGKDVG